MRRDRFQPKHLSVSTSEINFNSLRMTNWFCAENICLSVLPATLNDSGRATSRVKQQSTTFWTIASQQSGAMGFLQQSKQVWLPLCCMHADCHCSKRFRSSRTAVKYGAHVLYFSHLNLQKYSTNIQMHYVRMHGWCKRVILPLNSWQQRLAWNKCIQAFSSV